MERFEQFWQRAFRAFSSNFGKRPPAKIGKKMINLKARLGEINNIVHNKCSKIYPQNQVILDCIMPTLPLKHKCVLKYHSDMGHCLIFFFFTFLNWEKADMVLGKKVAIFNWEWGRNSAPREGQKMPWL